MRVFLPILVLLLSPWAAQADSCLALKNEPLFTGIVSKLDEARSKSIETLGFRVYDFPILLTSEEAPLCIGFYIKGKVEFKILTAPLDIANGTYDFRNEFNKMSAENEQQLKFLIEDRKIGEFLIYRIKKGLVDDFDDNLQNSLRTHFAFMVHEGFHLLGQDAWFKRSHYKPGKPYVSWSTEGRNFINSTCYGPRQDVKDVAYSEIDLLKTAMTQAYIQNDRPGALKTVRNFLKVRTGRYEMLKNQQFHPDTWDNSEGCPHGEAFMEHMEGTAKFVEMIYLLGTNLVRIEEWLNPISGKYLGKEFYVLGSLQLGLLYKLDPNFAELAGLIQNGGEPPDISLYTSRLQKLISY